jgi:predicted nucleotidyltransferase component of viral defense system
MIKAINKKIKQTQMILLQAFSRRPGGFALAGGTALELYYLHHRYSADLDFFSPVYDLKQIDGVISEFKNCKELAVVKLENEFISDNRARVRFYSASFKSIKRPLKVDFVEDVFFAKPDVKKFDGVPVYSVENIYKHKIIALAGTRPREDAIGRQIMEGRLEARDAFDIYMLSKNIKPLHQFLKGLSTQIQRGVVHWYRTFSRQDLKLGLLDLDIYVNKFDSREMIMYLEEEVKKFIKEVLEE